MNRGRTLRRRDFVKIAGAALGVAALGGSTGAVLANNHGGNRGGGGGSGGGRPEFPQLTPPSIECIGGGELAGGGYYITIKVYGTGDYGAPYGFSVHWMELPAGERCETFAWPDDERQYCKASFSGNPQGSPYGLGPGDCITIKIGDPSSWPQPGASLGENLPAWCSGPLECGKTYVFRVFAHAGTDTSTTPPTQYQKSDFSENVCCSTQCPAGGPEGCVYTQGYWKNHPDAWCVDGLEIGGEEYSKDQLLTVLWTPPRRGNAVLILAHQLIAALLNIECNGVTPPPEVKAAIASAHSLLSDYDITTGYERASSDIGQKMVAAAKVLDDFNNGGYGIPHCED